MIRRRNSILDKIGAQRQTENLDQYVSKIVEPYRELGRELYKEEAFTREPVQTVEPKKTSLLDKLKTQPVESYADRRDTRLYEQDIARKQEKETRETAKERSQMLERQLSDKYGIDIKRVNTPIELTNITATLPADRREQFRQDFAEYTKEIERSNPFRAGAESGFNVLPTMLERTKGNEEVTSAPGFGAGRFVGGVGQQAAFASVLGPSLESAFGKLGASPIVTETLKDVAIGTGTQLLEQPFDKTTPTQMLGNAALDIAINVVLGKLGKAFANASELASAKTPDVVEQVARELNVTNEQADRVIDNAINELRTRQTTVEQMLSPKVEEPKKSFKDNQGNVQTKQAWELNPNEKTITLDQAFSGVVGDDGKFYKVKDGEHHTELLERMFDSGKTSVNPEETSGRIYDVMGFKYGDTFISLKELDDTSGDLHQAIIKKATKEGKISSAINQPRVETQQIKSEVPISERTFKDIGKREVKAFQYENPEVKPFYTEKAQELLIDLRNSEKGTRNFNWDEYGEMRVTGVPRSTSPMVAEIKDSTGATYEQIEDALNRLINDAGQENQALAKRIEVILDEMLVDGYKRFDGSRAEPNIRYIQTRNRLDPNKIDIPQLRQPEASQLSNQLTMGEITQGGQASMFDSGRDDFDDFMDAMAPPKRPVAQNVEQPKPKSIIEKLQEPTAIPEEIDEPLLKKFRLDLFGATPTKPIKADLDGVEVDVVKTVGDVATLSNGKTASVKKLKPVREPIYVTKLIMTDLPKRQTGGIGQNFERIYQELISKTAPFETVARKANVPELRAASTNLNRTTGTIDYNISKAQSDMGGNQIGKSIKEIWQGVEESKKNEFFEYLLQKHNVDRMAQNKPVFGETITSEMSANRVAELEAQNPKYAEQQREITNYFENLINEWGVKSGLVSEETAQMLKQMYPNYVPTYRAVDIEKSMGGDGNFVSNILKKAKGSEKEILPLDQQMAILTNRTIRNARKNEVMTMLDDVYQANPEVANKYIFDVKKVGKKSDVKDILDVGKEIDTPVVKQGDKYTVRFYRNGEPYQMTINKTLYEAVATLEQDALDKGLNVIKTYATNPFKSLITQKNPIFFVRNVMRDIPTALIYSNDSIGLVRNTPVAIKEMLTNGKLWNQYQAMGGTRTGLFNYEKGTKIDFGTNKKGVVKKVLQGTGDALEMANNLTETLPRFAEYITAIKKGEPPMLALMRAAEITTDFSRFGRQTKRADAVIPYLNASVQGLDKFFRQMRDKPIQTMAKGGLVVSVPALILDQVNKNNEAYNEMTSRERNNYYHIPMKDGKFARIPRSREVGVLFGTALEWVSRLARGQEVTGEEVKEVLKSNFTPVNGFDSNIFKPALNFIDIATGKNPDAKNYFGSNIVSESLQRYSPGQQFNEKTTTLSKALGAYLDVPPVAIDYLFDSYLGVLADVGMPLLTENKKNAMLPLTNAFVADPVFKSASVDKFYQTLDTLNKLATDNNRNFDIPSELVTPYEKYRNELNKISKELSELRKEQVKASGDEEKTRELRIEMNKLSKKAVNTVPTEEELRKEFETFLKVKRIKGDN